MKSHRVIIRLKPKAKPRPRFSKRGRAYTPAAAHIFEDAVQRAWIESGGPTFTGPVSVSATFHKDRINVYVKELADDTTTSLTGDIDNYFKSLLDGLQGEDAAFPNDRQVMKITGRKA